MKKSLIAITVVAALAVAYPAASWLTGKRLETKLSQINAQDAVLSNFKIVKQSYTRGIFSSTQESTVELNFPGMGAKAMQTSFQDASAQAEPSADANADANADTDTAEQAEMLMPGKPLQFQIINRIQHGPVPGVFGIAAGKIDTELVLDAASIAEIKKVFGDKKFLEIRTMLNYGGGGSVKFTSPAATTVVGASQDKLDWKGIRFEVGFDATYKKLKFDLLSPGLEINAANGTTSVKVGEIKMIGDAERAYPESFIYLGTSKASVANVEFSNTQAPNAGFSLKNISLESITTNKGDLIDSALKIGVENIVVNKSDFGNFHYDYSLTRLHGPTINKMFKDIYSLNQTKSDAEKLVDLQNNWKQYGLELLKHEPVLSLDRLSLTSKSGEFKSTAKVKFAGVTEAEMADPALLISKLESTMDVSLAEGLVEELIEKTQTDPNARGMMKATFTAQVGTYEGMGYIKRNGKVLTSQMTFKEGKLLINGKAFPPAAPGVAK